MDNDGVHIQIINSILKYAESKWGSSAKVTLLKLSQINIEELEGLQNYQPKEIFFLILDIIKNDYNEELKIKEIGSFCGANVVKESIYIHPILSEGNPINFLKKADNIFNIFFKGLNIKISQLKGNNFLLIIPDYKSDVIYKFIHGFVEEIIINFSKFGRIKLKFKKNDKSQNQLIYVLKYQNILRKTENLIFFSSFVSVISIFFIILMILKTPFLYIIIMTVLSYFALIYPFNLFINRKKASYYRNLIKELNLHEKRLLNIDQEYSHEIFRLKTSINQLTELGNSILKEEDIEGIVEKIIYDALLLLGSERAIIFFYDKERHQFYGKDSYKKKNEIRFFGDEGIVGKIGKLKKPIIVNDPYANPFFSKSIDKQQEIVTKNLIGAPILDNQGELIGVMEVSNKIENNIYTDIDLNILIAICNYGSLAMQKYILMKKRISEEHTRIMSKISNYFSSKSFMNLIEDVNVPDFAGKGSIINKLNYFHFIFSEKNIFKTQIENFSKIKIEIEKDKNIKINFLSDKIKDINQNLIYQILLIMLKNSKKASFEKNIDFSAEIFFTDEITITSEIRNKYRLTGAINEWNTRTEKLGIDFIEYLKKTYPLMDEDFEQINKQIQYLPKMIFKDKCGGVSKDIEEKIFYPFYSTYEDLFGMGLKYLNKLIASNNGFIYFNNNENEGIEFSILFYKSKKLLELDGKIIL